jgi:hypothetical protein
MRYKPNFHTGLSVYFSAVFPGFLPFENQEETNEVTGLLKIKALKRRSTAGFCLLAFLLQIIGVGIHLSMPRLV